MSGIAGIYYLDQRPVERADLGRMVDVLAHRGPDGCNVWCDGAVGFGHRMLWTTPESQVETLPFAQAHSGLVITADARIDNRQELMTALGLTGAAQDVVTDSQIILAAYEKWGQDCPTHLVGDFAFAIWDPRQQILFCARDAMGVRPFYYYHSGNLFAFASEIKALLCLPQVPRQLNELQVAYHLVACFADKTSTAYQDIVRLPGATQMVVSAEQMHLSHYWQVDLSTYNRFKSREECAEAFRDVFTESVRCRMRSPLPVGAMLSGGLDSSSIACVARNLQTEAGQGPLPTFSYTFPTVAKLDPRVDESNYMRSVVATGGFSPHYIAMDEFSPLSDFDRVLWHLDGASPAPNLFMDWELFRETQKQGVRVLFTGHDGDETVSYGHESLVALARSGRWMRLYREARGMAKGFYGGAISTRKVIWKYGFRPMIPEPLYAAWDRLQGYGPEPYFWSVQGLINPELAQRLNLRERLLAYNPRLIQEPKEEHWTGVTDGLLQRSLQTLDELAAAFSIEVRHPFCDRRLIEFCLSVPPIYRLHNGWTRAVMREAMAGILPTDVQWRNGKANMGANFCLNLHKHEQQTLETMLFQKVDILAPYIDVAATQAAYHRYIAAPLKHRQDASLLFLAVSMGRWLEASEFDSGMPLPAHRSDASTQTALI
jgi:asparagine synthase (glutamine-hydrolysing)